MICFLETHQKQNTTLSTIMKCESCTAPSRFKCKECLAADYCSKECQKEKWRSHKKVCGKAVCKKTTQSECANCGDTKAELTPCHVCELVLYCSTPCRLQHYQEHEPKCLPRKVRTIAAAAASAASAEEGDVSGGPPCVVCLAPCGTTFEHEGDPRCAFFRVHDTDECVGLLTRCPYRCASFGTLTRLSLDVKDAEKRCKRAIELLHRPESSEADIARQFSVIADVKTSSAKHAHALLFARRGQSQALDLFYEALILDSTDPALHLDFGEYLLDRGDRARAEEEVRVALLLDPNRVGGYKLLTRVYHEVEDWGRALDACGNAIRLKPDDATGRFIMANMLTEAGRFDEAVSIYRRTLFFPDAYVALGNLLRRMNKLDSSLKTFDTCLAQHPTFRPALYGIALTLSEMRDGRDLDYWTRIALKHQAEDAVWIHSVHKMVMGYAEQRGDLFVPIACLKLWGETVKDPELLKEIYRLEGYFQNRLGRTELAVAAYTKSIEIRAATADDYYQLGLLQGDDRAMYEAAVALDPNHADARFKLCTTLEDFSRLVADAPTHLGAQIKRADLLWDQLGHREPLRAALQLPGAAAFKYLVAKVAVFDYTERLKEIDHAVLLEMLQDPVVGEYFYETQVRWAQVGLKQFPNCTNLLSFHGDLERALQLDPKNVLSLLKLKDVDKLKTINDYNAQLFVGIHFFNELDFPKAEKHLNRAFKLKQDAEPLMYLARIGNRQTLSTIESIQHFERALKYATSADDKYECFSFLAIIYFCHGDYAKSEERLWCAMKCKPLGMEALVVYAKLLKHKTLYDTAKTVLLFILEEKGLFYKRESPKLFAEAAFLYSMIAGDDAEIRKYLIVADTFRPSAIYKLALAKMWTKEGATRDAIFCLEGAIAVEPDCVDAWKQLAELWHDLGEPKNKIAALHSLTRLQPNDLNVWFSYAQTLTINNQFEDATAAFTVAIKLRGSPKEKAEVYGQFAMLLAMEKKYEQSLVYLTKACEMDKTSAYLQSVRLFAKAECANNSGDKDIAKDYLQQAMKLNPDMENVAHLFIRS